MRPGIGEIKKSPLVNFLIESSFVALLAKVGGGGQNGENLDFLTFWSTFGANFEPNPSTFFEGLL